MSAVSSVNTLGVLVTMMPRAVAAGTSILSTPLPKLAMSLREGPAAAMSSASISSVTVGTNTSAVAIAAASASRDIGWSSALSLVSKSSQSRVSTMPGSRRVTMTTGRFGLAIGVTPERNFGVAFRHRRSTIRGPFRSL